MAGNRSSSSWESEVDRSELPDDDRNSLVKNVVARDRFIKIWSECLDYGLGIAEVMVENDASFFQQLLRSADGQLNAAVSLLHERRPNPKALESARMATEMFLKAYLARNVALTEENARRTLGHDLERAVDRIIQQIMFPRSQVLEVTWIFFPMWAIVIKGPQGLRRNFGKATKSHSLLVRQSFEPAQAETLALRLALIN